MSPGKQEVKKNSSLMGGKGRLRQMTGLFLGPVLFMSVVVMPDISGLSQEARMVLAVAFWMAAWWITEAVPIPATSLLPIILFPATGVMTTQAATYPYANHLVFLFMGGFMIALAMERWNLHRRIALLVIRALGESPERIILGFMVSTAALSMWISNTATAMMMTPIGLAVIYQTSEMLKTGGDIKEAVKSGKFQFGTALMLGIAYSASIGGIATIIGTPPNAVFAGILKEMYDVDIGFAQWMLYGVPLAALFLVFTWLYLVRMAFTFEFDEIPGGMDVIKRELKKLGPVKRQEIQVLAVFLLTGFLWVIRGFLLSDIFPKLSDASIAIFGAMLLFVIPVNFRKGEFLLDWETARKIPWGILLLFGGGISLAEGFQVSGLAEWLAMQLSGLQGASLLLIVASVVVLAIFLTEMTSNTATATMLMPIMAALAVAVGIHPYATMVAAAVACSFAFMLPVATPPNAIVFGSGYITIPTMARAGLVLNIAGIILVTIVTIYLMPLVWNIDLSTVPLWAN